MQQMFSEFAYEYSQDPIPGILTVDGRNTRLTLGWQRLLPPEPWRVAGSLKEDQVLSLWGLRPVTQAQDETPMPWLDIPRTCLTFSPAYGVVGPTEFNQKRMETQVSSVAVRSPFLTLYPEDGPAESVDTPYGTLSVGMDSPGPHSPATIKLQLEFTPVPFESGGKMRMGVLNTLCEMLTGTSHDVNGVVFKVPDVEGSYTLYDFIMDGYKSKGHRIPSTDSMFTAKNVLNMGKALIERCAKPNTGYTSFISHVSQVLDFQYGYPHLLVLQTTNMFELFQPGNIPGAIEQRIQLIADDIESNPSPEITFTTDQLHMFKDCALAMREYMMHGIRDTADEDPVNAPRAFVKDSNAQFYVVFTLSFVMALSILIECGYQAKWLYRWNLYNKFHEIASDLKAWQTSIDKLSHPA